MIVVLSLSIKKAVDMDMWRISVIFLAVFCGRSLSWGGGKLDVVLFSFFVDDTSLGLNYQNIDLFTIYPRKILA